MLDLTKIPDAVRSEGSVSRRLVLAYGAALAGLPLVSSRLTAADRKIVFESNPFTLGVASGDPDANSLVLWTKLAPDPTTAQGGMNPEMVPVSWEIAEDESMNKVVFSGIAVATPQLGHSVHVEVQGLKPARWYWYRFRAGDAVSPIGRTRTLPEPNAEPGSRTISSSDPSSTCCCCCASLLTHSGRSRIRLPHTQARACLRHSLLSSKSASMGSIPTTREPASRPRIPEGVRSPINLTKPSLSASSTTAVAPNSQKRSAMASASAADSRTVTVNRGSKIPGT